MAIKRKPTKEEQDKLDRLAELAQEKDIADTRQRQLVEELDPDVLRRYFDDQHKAKLHQTYSSIAKWVLATIIPLMLSGLGSYAVMSWNDKIESTKEVIFLKRQAEDNKDSIKMNKEEIGKMGVRITHVENLQSGIKTAVEIWSQRITALEARNGK